MIDKIIDIIVIASFIATVIGAVVAIWFGLIGLKIAGTALVIIAALVEAMKIARYMKGIKEEKKSGTGSGNK